MLRIYGNSCEPSLCYESLLKLTASNVERKHSCGEVAEEVYEKFKKVYEKAVLERENLSVECLKRMQEVLERED